MADEQNEDLEWKYPRLVWWLGIRAGSEDELRRDYIIVGRDPSSSHVLVEDDLVSKRHAALAFDEQWQATLIDLASKNGTFVNGMRVLRTSLGDNDVISLGPEGSPTCTYRAAASASAEHTGSNQSIAPPLAHATGLDETCIFRTPEPAADKPSSLCQSFTQHAKSTKLSDRIRNILATLVHKGSITEFGEIVRSNVEVYTKHCANEMQTSMRFDHIDDTLLVRIKHLFAFIEDKDGRDPKSLARVLAANRESYKDSSFYLSAKKYNKCLWVYLECTHPYHCKWGDEEIADTLSALFNELDRVLSSAPPPPIRILEKS